MREDLEPLGEPTDGLGLLERGDQVGERAVVRTVARGPPALRSNVVDLEA